MLLSLASFFLSPASLFYILLYIQIINKKLAKHQAGARRPTNWLDLQQSLVDETIYETFTRARLDSAFKLESFVLKRRREENSSL